MAMMKKPKAVANPGITAAGLERVLEAQFMRAKHRDLAALTKPWRNMTTKTAPVASDIVWFV